MASGEVYSAIKAHIESNWDSSAVPIQWENEDFDFRSEFISVEIAGTMYGQMSLGAGAQEDNRWDEEGQLFIHVVVPQGSGSIVARNRAKQIADLFRGTLLLEDRLEFLDASIGLGEGGQEEGLTWRITVSVEWRYQDA